PSAKSLSSLFIREKLREPFNSLNGELTPLQKRLAPLICGYKDILFTPETYRNQPEIRKLYILHCLNHVLKTRKTILKNNEKLAVNSDLELRDQGFTRPRVLIIVPTRKFCYDIVEDLLKILNPDQVENHKRFTNEFESDTPDLVKRKPEDFQFLFGGNTDDNFRLGIKLTRKAAKIYSDFYSSDIIIGSALGLRLAISDEDGDDIAARKRHDHDFLSSIEVCIVDYTDAIAEQNWSHLMHVFKYMNKMPEKPHGCDFSRVRTFYLDEKADEMRQTIVLSEYITPEINALHNRGKNVSGKQKFKPVFDKNIAETTKVQYERIGGRTGMSIVDEPDVRFKHFTSVIMPSIARTAPIREQPGSGVVVVVPDYIDFVRLRNYMKKNSVGLPSFESVSEYSSGADIARARTLFADGRKHVLLYTWRAHHYRRYMLKGVRKVVMYSLPSNPLYFREFLSMVEQNNRLQGVDGESGQVRAIFSRYDSLKLERIVGSDAAKRMV
ncbi:hypothetical protein CANCADRAFT_20476, partial [Tortispora caseinolytica NRRL Y-17796]